MTTANGLKEEQCPRCEFVFNRETILSTGISKLEFSKNNDGTYTVTGIGACTDTEIVIPASYNGSPVTHIGNSAFKDCSNLTSITIPNSVTSIGDLAFSGCSNLTEITIPDSVTNIRYAAFWGCSSLTSITLPFVGNTANGTSNMHFGYIFGASSFDQNKKHIPASLKTVVITGGTSIDDFAFMNCINLRYITIPKSIKSIGEEAFSICPLLMNITFGGTKAQWSAIAFGPSWNVSTGKLHGHLHRRHGAQILILILWIHHIPCILLVHGSFIANHKNSYPRIRHHIAYAAHSIEKGSRNFPREPFSMVILYRIRIHTAISFFSFQSLPADA